MIPQLILLRGRVFRLFESAAVHACGAPCFTFVGAAGLTFGGAPACGPHQKEEKQLFFYQGSPRLSLVQYLKIGDL